MLRRGWNAARRLTGTWTVKAQRWSRPSRLFSTEAAHPERVIPVEAPTMKEAKVGRVKKDGSTPRFYKKVSVVHRQEEDGSLGGWEVELDRRYAILSSGRSRRLVLPSEQLAVAIALDWENMHERTDLKRMPLYTLSSVAVDSDAEHINKMKSVILSILDTDNVCCRPDNENPDVQELQKHYQDPLVNWFQSEFGVPLNVTTSFEMTQPPETIAKMKALVDQLDVWQLSGLYSLTEACMSLVTALALHNRVCSVDDALKATRTEMIPFERKWGDVPGSTDLRRAEVKMDIATASTYLRLLNPIPLNKQPKIAAALSIS